MMDIVALKNTISRRSLLQSVSFVAATAFSLECITPNAASAQQSKLSQMLSKYQDTPKNGQQCSTCSRVSLRQPHAQSSSIPFPLRAGASSS